MVGVFTELGKRSIIDSSQAKNMNTTLLIAARNVASDWGQIVEFKVM